ncbi:MAG: PDDEXK nuclease domain-containing protein [Candidatus Caenarcaniphilales bacterium]|nr:PDDEXK nuclease domain-containing protein [Candidatus Caenarcaniphilales bacterium]
MSKSLSKHNLNSFKHLSSALKKIQESHFEYAQKTINRALVSRNWFFGYYIVEFENGSATRKETYGKNLILELSKVLTGEGIKGCSVTNLKQCRNFYLAYPEIGRTVSDQSQGELINQFKLNWSHYIFLMSIKDKEERNFYEIECISENWSLRELKRQFDSSLYERLLVSKNDDKVKQLSKEGQVIASSKDIIKDPYILEFLNLSEKESYSESDLESGIIDKLEHFLLELGKGFLFEARQKRLSFEEEHFYVDLVFYNRLLRAYVLIDLKIGELKHQDLGQMQMYVNYFDRFVKKDYENKTIGIVICKKKKDALVEITLPEDSNIHASEYRLYLPSKKQIKEQIENANH